MFRAQRVSRGILGCARWSCLFQFHANKPPKAQTLVPVRLSPIQGGFDRESAALENMGVDHRGFDILMPEQFLDGPDIIAILQEVGREGMAECVRCDPLFYPGELGGFADGTLDGGFVDVVALDLSGDGVGRQSGCGEDVLPDPLLVGSASVA